MTSKFCLSYLRGEGIAAAGGARLRFSASSNRTYTVEYMNGIDSLFWTRLADAVAGATNRVVDVLDSLPVSGSTQRIYRLVSPRLP